MEQITQITQRLLEVLKWTEKVGVFNTMNFEKKVGLSGGTVSKWEKGADSSLKTIIKVLYTFPSISAEWLIRGEGSIERIDEKQEPAKPVVTEEEKDSYVKRIEDENKFLRNQLETALNALAFAHKHYSE